MRIMSKSDALHVAAGFAVTVVFWVIYLLARPIRESGVFWPD